MKVEPEASLHHLAGEGSAEYLLYPSRNGKKGAELNVCFDIQLMEHID